MRIKLVIIHKGLGRVLAHRVWGLLLFFNEKKISIEFYSAPWAMRILHSGNTGRFLNFRSFSF